MLVVLRAATWTDYNSPTKLPVGWGNTFFFLPAVIWWVTRLLYQTCSLVAIDIFRFMCFINEHCFINEDCQNRSNYCWLAYVYACSRQNLLWYFREACDCAARIVWHTETNWELSMENECHEWSATKLVTKTKIPSQRNIYLNRHVFLSFFSSRKREKPLCDESQGSYHSARDNNAHSNCIPDSKRGIYWCPEGFVLLWV